MFSSLKSAITKRQFSSSNAIRNIGFSLSEDQRDLQELARKFTAEYIIPNVND